MRPVLLDTKQRRRHQRGRSRVFYAGRDVLEIPLTRGGAGSYPDAPSRRMAWDDDGTIFMVRRIAVPAGGQIELSASVMTELNDEDNVVAVNYASNPDLLNPGSPQELRHTHIFPELREVDGYYGANDQSNTPPITQVLTSGDTTNGIGGTFTSRIATYVMRGDPYPDDYRDNITSLAVSNVRALAHRFSTQDNEFPRIWKAIHIYGEISAGETPDRLLWFDDDDDLEFGKPQDYGDVPRGSAEDHVVYLKNNSASLAASTVQVTAEDLYLGSGAWFTFSEGGSFFATLALASSIGAAANSPNITVRRIIPDAATVGLHAARAYANVGSWA